MRVEQNRRDYLGYWIFGVASKGRDGLEIVELIFRAQWTGTTVSRFEQPSQVSFDDTFEIGDVLLMMR
jgi:hypothetical protein